MPRKRAAKAPQQAAQQQPPRPSGPATPWPCPALTPLREQCHGGFTTARTQAIAAFRDLRGEQKWVALQQLLFLQWPEDFTRECRVDPNGNLIFVPTPKWNPWMLRILKAMVGEEHAVRQGDSVFRSVVLTGCGGAGKTFTVGLYAVAWWAIDPENSIAVLTSTTKDMIRNRVWNVVRHFASSARDLETGIQIPLGRLVDSQMKLVVDNTSTTNPSSICAYAVAHGETLKAIDNLKGLHAKRMLVVIDEANGTPEAIFQVLSNYRKACLDLTVVIIGNPCARLDPHGRACTPIDGWGSYNSDLIEWRTRAVPEWQLDSGVCLRFDGRDSPNVKAGRNRYPYIYTLDNWNQAESHKGTFGYWTQDRGMWPPEGFANTVFTEQLLTRCGALDNPYRFDSTALDLAFLDPAFGGDACILQFARLGDVNGRLVIQLTDWLEVPIDPDATAHDIDYQVARRVQQECVVRRINPFCFGLDATGIGRGVGAILASEWSSQIQYLQWGQGATQRPSAQNDGRPANEVYTTFVGEMWFAAREALEAGQLRGFSQEAMTQFCSRLFEMQGKKYKLETKVDMKSRLRFSPDHADAVVGIIEVARRNNFMIENSRLASTAARDWRTLTAASADPIYGMEPAHEPKETGWAEADLDEGGGAGDGGVEMAFSEGAGW